MKKHVAISKLEKAGWNVLEQRGFYSHFLRIRRHVNMQTVGYVEIDKAGNCERAEVYKIARNSK